MKIDQNVMAVLSAVQCDGHRAVIVQQLDRKLYTQVNEVLVALGGKWTRGAKAHVFAGDAAERIDQAILHGDVTTHKDIGFFPTPPQLAERLVAMADVKAGDLCLEPSAGKGAIVQALLSAGDVQVDAIERDPGMRSELASRAKKARSFAETFRVFDDDDFMAFDDRRYDAIVMNPPFRRVGKGDHLDHAQHAYSILRPGGTVVCVLPSSVRFRMDQRHRLFRAWAESVGAFTDLPAQSFRESGTDVNTCVLVVTKFDGYVVARPSADET